MAMFIISRKITLSILIVIVLVCGLPDVGFSQSQVPVSSKYSDLQAAIKAGDTALAGDLIDRAPEICVGLQFPRDTFAADLVVNSSGAESLLLVAHRSDGYGVVQLAGATNVLISEPTEVDFNWFRFVKSGEVWVVTRFTGASNCSESEQSDLAVDHPTVSKNTLKPGESFTLSTVVRNSGTGSAAATTLRYYRSTDATISSSDTAVGTDSVNALNANGTSAESISLTAPASAGTYYYGACVDAVADESNSDNNCSAGVRITVEVQSDLSDLIVDRPTVSKSTLTAGESFTLSTVVRNSGTSSAAATTLRYYRSADSTISTSDTAVGTASVSALNANGRSAESISLTAPTSAGTYYFGACVDSVANESDKTNNCSASVRITVEAKKEPTLHASTSAPLTETVLDGSDVALTLRNGAWEQSLSRISNAVMVSGIAGVTVNRVRRESDTQITIVLAFDGTDFDTNATLSFSVRAGGIASYSGSSLTANVPVAAVREQKPLAIYWIDRGTMSIRAASSDASRIETLVQRGLQQPSGLTLDVTGGHMYWTDSGTDKIQRADLNGANVQDLVTQGLKGTKDIALDVAAGKMYWTDNGTDKIQRADLDGSNVEDLLTRGLRIPSGLALDVDGGQMYWTDDGTNKIQRADLDGTNVEDLVTGLQAPTSIALDVADGKMYWTDAAARKIQRADLDGSNVEDVVTELAGVHSLDLDIDNRKIYWTDWRDETVRRANLDASNVEDVIASGMDRPSSIAINASPQPIESKDPDDETEDETVEAKDADANGDGSVDVQDIVYVALHYGQTSQGAADINGDGVVNIDDIIAVAAAVDSVAAAPAARAAMPRDLTAEMVENWLTEAKLAGKNTPQYQRGILTLEQLLAVLAPKETALLPNYPNPFNPETWIPYRLATGSDVQISIYDLNGALIRQLDLGHQRAGVYIEKTRAAYWDGRNENGEAVASGAYFYQLRTDDYNALRRMVIVK